MRPGSVLLMPKPDKRYRQGVIKKDKRGTWRGHPDTVVLRYYGQSLNPALMATEPLVQWMKNQGII